MHPGIRTSASLLLLFLLVPAGPGSVAGAQPLEVPGLQAEAVVVLDGEGIPHICGQSQQDAVFLQGYFHARDRFFQMDTLRRTFSGRLAELVGPAAVAQDVQFRTLGLDRAAAESWQAYQDRGLEESVAWLESYAAGVNAYLASHPLPPEYGALELTSAEPWTPLDSLVIAKGLAFGLSFDLRDVELTIQSAAYSAAGAALGFDGRSLLFEDVSRHAPFDDAISIPGALPQATTAAVAPRVPADRTAALARKFRDKALDVPRLARAFEGHHGDTGSNWWILSGEVTESGHPMLANDPHLSLDIPAIWYEAHLISSLEPRCGLDVDGEAALGVMPQGGETDERDVVLDENLDAGGVTFAGVPGVVLGCNQVACWGATVNPMDVTDVYQEVLVLDSETGLPSATIFEGQPEPLEIIPQTYLVNQPGNGVPDDLADAGVGPAEGGVTLVVPRRNRGPIVEIDASQDPPIGLSVQYTGWRATTELEAFRRFGLARNPSEFSTALQFFDVGSQNFAYADVEGNVAYFTSAEMPIREDLQTLGAPDGGIPPYLIRDGTHSLRHEWLPVENPQPTQSLDFEILPFAEMPQTVNPERGWVANANNDPIGTTLDNNPLNQLRPGGGLYYLSPGYVSLRMGRIDRVLEEILADGPADVADMEALQANNELLDAELVVPFVLDAFARASAADADAALRELADDASVAEAVARLAEWDFGTPTGLEEGYDPDDAPGALDAPSAPEIADSVAATIWSATRGQLVRTVIDDTLESLGLGDFLPGSRLAYAAVAHHLRTFGENRGMGASGVNFFPGPLSPGENRDLVLLGALRDALDLLASDGFAPAFGGSTEQDDYRWGKLHRIVFDHPLGGPFSIPPAGGFADVSPDLRGVARAGGYEAVDASSHSARADGAGEFMFGSGASRRFVGVLDPAGIDARQILPGGQSGVLGSPRYADQMERWLTNEYHPVLLSDDAVSAGAEEILFFERPRCVPGPETLCLHDRRFSVRLERESAGGELVPASVVPGFSSASGNFTFFGPENWEFLVKVLDGCALNGHYWVFASPATDVGWELVVEDTVSGESWSMSRPGGSAAPPITDTRAFATCP